MADSGSLTESLGTPLIEILINTSEEEKLLLSFPLPFLFFGIFSSNYPLPPSSSTFKDEVSHKGILNPFFTSTSVYIRKIHLKFITFLMKGFFIGIGIGIVDFLVLKRKLL